MYAYAAVDCVQQTLSIRACLCIWIYMYTHPIMTLIIIIIVIVMAKITQAGQAVRDPASRRLDSALRNMGVYDAMKPACAWVHMCMWACLQARRHVCVCVCAKPHMRHT